jgi:hypothetical protein
MKKIFMGCWGLKCDECLIIKVDAVEVIADYWYVLRLLVGLGIPTLSD